MSKIVAVWGSPYSGKTTCAMKFARIMHQQGLSAVYVGADMKTPILPVLFPNLTADEMVSIGNILSKLDITEDDVLKNMVVKKKSENIGFMGFKDCENKFSYPEFTVEKVIELFSTLDTFVDVIIVDCTSDTDNIITNFALRNALVTIRLSTATANSISFFSSQLPLMSEYDLDKHLMCLNIPDSSVYVPTNEALDYFKIVDINIPYSSQVKSQYMKGELLEQVLDKKFNNALCNLAKKVLEDE